MSPTLKTLAIRPLDVGLAPLSATSGVADVEVTVSADRDVALNDGSYIAGGVPIVATSMPATGLSVPILANDDPNITTGAGFSPDALARIAPALATQGLALLLTFYLWAAARIVKISGRLPRPWPDIPSTRMPRAVVALLGLAVVLAFVPGYAGVLGMALGGPLGALAGSVAGHFLVDREGAPFGPTPREVVFTTGLVALAAKVAKSDGVVAPSEVEAFGRVIEVSEAEVDAGQHDALGRLDELLARGLVAVKVHHEVEAPVDRFVDRRLHGDEVGESRSGGIEFLAGE